MSEIVYFHIEWMWFIEGWIADEEYIWGVSPCIMLYICMHILQLLIPFFMYISIYLMYLTLGLLSSSQCWIFYHFLSRLDFYYKMFF